MRIYDEVLDSINENIAMFEPERGGVLFGPIGRDVISLFVFDSSAHTTFSSYTISREMCELVPQIERKTKLEYKGIVHSHPARLDSPSHGDQLSARNALNINPHMSRFYIPIITHIVTSRDSNTNTIQLRDGKLSSYCAIKTNRDRAGVRIAHEPVAVIPILKSLREVTELLKSQADYKRISMIDSAERIFLHDGAMNMAYTLNVDEYMFMILVNEMFPENAPNLLLSANGSNTEAVPLSWSMGCDPEDEILKGIVSATKSKRELTHSRLHSTRTKRRRSIAAIFK